MDDNLAGLLAELALAPKPDTKPPFAVERGDGTEPERWHSLDEALAIARRIALH